MRNIWISMHKRDKISVTLSAWTGGTAVFTTSALWPVYSLSSLPIWTQIQLVQIQWVDTYVFLDKGSEIWSLTITASSWYNFDSVKVNNTTVTSTAITLNDWDEIDVSFIVLDYLCFTANTAGSTVQLKKNGTPAAITLEVSSDKINWSTYTFDTDITLTNIEDKVYFRNTSTTTTGFATSTSNYYQFVMSWSVSWSWDINYLLNKNSTTTVSSYCYYCLFYQCTSLTTAPSLPATTLTYYCYWQMFSWCTSLTTAPVLPATTLTYGCYFNMFYNCSSLTTAPALPATTLAQYCYYQMFYWCTWLTSTPALSATTLANYCYYSMFYNCSSLTTAPALPATTLAISCYQNIFWWCTSITEVPALPATTLANYCYWGMFAGCTSLTSVPALSATTLADYCYYRMFYWCSKIKVSETQTWDYQTEYRIPISWTGTTATSALSSMFSSTGWTFKSTPTINTTYYTSNTVVS